MDVYLSGLRILFLSLALLSSGLVSCGNRYDLSTERGRRSRIDDANFHLSRGQCEAADEAINPLYASAYVDDEVRIVKASATACYARFNVLTLLSSISGSSNYFQALAKALDNTAGDKARTYLYAASDVLTQTTAALDASNRSRSVNGYMVLLQFGVISAIIRTYGTPDTSGAQGPDLVYEVLGANPPAEMSDLDACALASAFSHISNSFPSSDFSDSDTGSLVDAIDSICVAGGIGSCSTISRDRTSCTGANANSVTAAGVVSGVNAAW